MEFINFAKELLISNKIYKESTGCNIILKEISEASCDDDIYDILFDAYISAGSLPVESYSADLLEKLRA